MFRVSQKQFESLIAHALDSLPVRYIKRLDNVAIVSEDSPSQHQLQKLHLHNGQTLYGLYEGIPMTQRGANYNFVLPDKITIFKQPIEANSSSLADLKEQIRHTVWHEVAHFFGLNHDAIYKKDGTASEKK